MTHPPDKPARSEWTWPSSPGDALPGPTGPVALSSRARRLGWAVAGLGVVIAVAATLPWSTVGSMHFDGTAGDGILTLVFGSLAAIAGIGRVLTKRQGTWQVTWPMLSATMSAFVIVIAYSDVLSVAKIATVGIGLLLTLAAGIGLAAASILALLWRT